MMINTRAVSQGRPKETGELQAALAASASMNSWLEAPEHPGLRGDAPGVTTDGSLAVFAD